MDCISDDFGADSFNHFGNSREDCQSSITIQTSWSDQHPVGEVRTWDCPVLQPFFSLSGLPYPGEPVPEETFTHSHLS